MSGQKIFCPTFMQTKRFLDAIHVVKQPKYILLHCGTNDLENPDFSEEKFENDFIVVVSRLREVFPSARITVSSLLPRDEMKFYCPLRNLNDFLAGCCSAGHNIVYMRNSNIKFSMLLDNKHINYEGFKILLANIRFTVFRKIPYR